MNLYDAIYSRRSVRNFTNEHVPEEILKRIVRAGIEAPSGCNAQLRQFIIVTDHMVLDKLREVSSAIDGAPAVIVLLVDPSPTQYGEFWIQDISAAMQNMLLSTVAEGYASCWIEGQIRPKEQELHELLDVPENLKVWSMMPVGKAVVPGKRPEKSKFEEIVHFNKFGGK